MCLHVVCALIALIKWKSLGDAYDDFDDDIWVGIGFFLLFFPVFVIPIFWIVYLVTKSRQPIPAAVAAGEI